MIARMIKSEIKQNIMKARQILIHYLYKQKVELKYKKGMTNYICKLR